MQQRRSLYYSVQAAALSSFLLADIIPAFAANTSENCCKYVAPSSFLVGSVIIFFLGMLLLALFSVRNALAADSSKWSLSDALSESSETDHTSGEKNCINAG